MIVATNNCGCPSKSPCSPCCSVPLKPLKPQTISYPNSPCCASRPAQPSTTIEFPCCPIDPRLASGKETEDGASTKKEISEIAQKGVPYSEVEAVINNNRVILRMQKELVQEEYDPPCDCIEDSANAHSSIKSSDSSEEKGTTSACRTVTLYSQPREKSLSDSIESERKPKKDVQIVNTSKTPGVEDNPNIFLLRIKRKCEDGDKKYNVNVEFRVPRPWSLKRRLEAEKIAGLTKPEKSILKEESKADGKKEAQVAFSSSKKGRKKKKT